MGDSFRFIHCSDLHLGCRFSGISDADEDLGRRLRESVFTALDNIVSFAKKEKVDFVIFSGDIFDSTNETPLTRSRFADAIASMKVPCYIIYGNHDTKRRWENSIPLPKNAFVFPEQITHMYFEKDGRKVTELIGMSFPSMKPNTNYVKSVKKESDLFAIGVFHCNVDGAKDDNYSPCKLSDMKDKDVSYWALGHIHKASILNRMPYVVYSGNTQGMDPKESGEKGAYLVTVNDGAVVDISPFKTSAIDWVDVNVDITGKTDFKTAIDELSKIKKNCIASITFSGRGPLDAILRTGGTESIKEMIENSIDCKISSVIVRTVPDIDLKTREEINDFTSAVISYGNRISGFGRKELIDMICSTTVSQSRKSMFESLSDDELKDIVDDAMYLVIEKMMGAEQ